MLEKRFSFSLIGSFVVFLSNFFFFYNNVNRISLAGKFAEIVATLEYIVQ